MALRTITPGLRALDPLTPIGHTSWGPIFHGAGGRAGSRGVDIIVGDDEGDDPDFDDDDDDDDDEPDDDDDERQRQQNREDAARGWQKPKPKAKAKQRREPDPDDEDDESDDEEGEPDARADQRRSRGRRGSAEDTDEWTPPTRDQWDRMSDAVSRNNGELRKRRFLGKPLERLGITDEETFRDKMIEWGRDPDSGERLEGGEYEGSDSDLFEQPDGQDRQQNDADRTPKRTKAEIAAERRRHEERGMARAEARYKPGMALFAAEAELRSAGWSGKDIALAIKLIDPDGIEVEFDEFGWPTVHGIEDQVAKIKDEFPDWFRPRRAAPRDEDAEDGRRERPARLPARLAGTRQVDGGERRRPADKPMTWLQRADAQMMGKRV